MKPPKPPKCAYKKCRKEFEKKASNHVMCSYECALADIRDKKEKQAEKEWKVRKKVGKEKLKSVTDYRNEARKIFQRWIRIRDLGQKCISCDVLLTDIREFDAGHYYPANNYPTLLFDPMNVHGQCKNSCNNHKSGNLIEYRKGLLARYGGEVLRYLDDKADDKSQRTLTKEYYIEITEKYKKLCKEIER